ncbi:NAD(P)-dependent oxidoreductase [Mucilaginibacter paludis]|uniref:NAD-dependent epimerase/dehydratase n=1 Tax=Mucilaginibacter paludis DSM 18603 TaxID=714943 RepID=H1Y994_9SPHI|nr:NAD(P)-binding oxidoreductase [Mucilaginibacter paludis]EHQ29472.1 NAD-dependent epimerase/dehydratase [Mucilaginibacter paludis DSM 18603]
MSKRILILGATGRTGKHAIPFALAKGYQVVALVRDPAKIGVTSDDLTIVTGLPTNADDIRGAMKGCDAVLSLLSPLTRGEAISFRKINAPRVLERSMINVLQVMNEYGVKRILILSSVGVGDSWKYAPWYVKLLVKLTNFKVIFADHNAQERLVQASGTDWTIARPVGLNENVTAGKIAVTYDHTPKPFQMSRKLLAKFFIDNLYSETYIHKAPMLSEI